MKKILASLLTAYVLTNGQAPPANIVPEVVNPQTASTSAATTAPPGTTSAPATVTSAPGTSAPVQTAAPITTSAPVTTAAPRTSAAVASVSSAPASVTSAPGTSSAPVTTSAPGTTAAAVAALTSAPVTTTSAPIPATPTPTLKPTLNPYCPLDAGMQSGIDPLSVQFNENAVCFLPTEIATDYLGRLRCENFACCQCAQINCGFDGYPCEQIQFGDSGGVGVQSINIRGAPELNNNPMQNIFGGGFGNTHGAKLECSGRESCLGSVIRGEMISEAQCSGDMGCQDAKIIINDPMPMMNMQCNGLSSCQRSHIEINVGVSEAAARAPGQACNPAYAGVVTELGKVEFNGQWSGSGAKVMIRNEGCGTLLLDGFECMNLEACPGLAVTVEGNVAIRHCDLMGIAPNNPLIQSLVAACQAGQNYGNWNTGNQAIFPGTFPQQPQVPVIPPNPGQQPPVIPPNPGNPTPIIPSPAVPAPPSNPIFPGQTFPGFGVPLARDPRSAKLQCDQVGMPAMLGMGMPFSGACAGTTQTIQIANNFVLDCSLAGACDGMTLTLNAGYDPIRNPIVPTTRIDALKFIQRASGVTIYINNEFGATGQPLRIENVRCENPGSCANLKIIAGPGVDVLSTNYDCSDIRACVGATVQQGTMTMPMDPRTVGMFQPGQPMPFNPWV